MSAIYRAEVIGSMLRPAYLKDARREHDAGRLATWEFKQVEDRAVGEMIALQEQCGVDVITDGEMRRT
ncbi:MAG: cobalamin-independent methionine synthase II family protein, partial [Candidatus Binataceae bacterium]